MRDILSYLAGIVDGEGYIGIKKSSRLKTCPSPTYHERIQIRMVDEVVIKLFKKTFGGNYYLEKSPYGNRPLYCYQASDLIASKILEILLDYLLLKRDQALTVLKLRKSKETKQAKMRGGRKGNLMNPKILDYRESLYIECKKLNGGKNL